MIAASWFFLAPPALGGATSYVVTDGTSMLPRFKADGLVLVRARDSYHVGEVVAYHNQQLHRVVMHRIVGMDGARYIFKGDNNNFTDLYHATRADLVGQEWIYWPNGGKYFAKLRNPAAFGIGLALVTVAALYAPERRGRHRRHHG